MEESNLNLNARQQEFVRQYVAGTSATAAYKAVYGEQDEAQAAANASRLIRNDKVQQQIAKHRQQLDQAALITTEHILIRTASLATTAKRDGDKLKALDMLAKMRGMYTQKLQVETTPGIIVNVYPAPLPTEPDANEQHPD